MVQSLLCASFTSSKKSCAMAEKAPFDEIKNDVRVRRSGARAAAGQS